MYLIAFKNISAKKCRKALIRPKNATALPKPAALRVEQNIFEQNVEQNSFEQNSFEQNVEQNSFKQNVEQNSFEQNVEQNSFEQNVCAPLGDDSQQI
jgi:hypothetical protein